MTLRDVAAAVSAEILCGSEEQLDLTVQVAASSDLMSDILARVGVPDVMLTGLATNQTVRTSAVAGIRAIVFVRGKAVNESLIELAGEEDIVLMSSPLSLFEASGRLYEKGLRSEPRVS